MTQKSGKWPREGEWAPLAEREHSQQPEVGGQRPGGLQQKPERQRGTWRTGVGGGSNTSPVPLGENRARAFRRRIAN